MKIRHSQLINMLQDILDNSTHCDQLKLVTHFDYDIEQNELEVVCNKDTILLLINNDANEFDITEAQNIVEQVVFFVHREYEVDYAYLVNNQQSLFDLSTDDYLQYLRDIVNRLYNFDEFLVAETTYVFTHFFVKSMGDEEEDKFLLLNNVKLETMSAYDLHCTLYDIELELQKLFNKTLY